VFRAFDPDRDRLVAVKLFRLDLPPGYAHQLVGEFERLIEAGRTHPAVVAPVAAGIEGVTAYLAQDYVTAESLDTTLRYGPASVADSLRVAAELAGALDAAAAFHIEHGVLHPRDVLWSADEVRVTGLGVARAVERIGGAAPVRRPYTAPERTIGSNWDRRADVFSLAAMVHEMLWGRRITGAGDQAAGSLTEIAGGDLSQLRAVFGRALANDPAERFDTALEFADALQGAFSISTVVALPAYPARPAPPVLDLREPEPSRFAEIETIDAPIIPAVGVAEVPPLLPPELMDSYRPSGSVPAGERSQAAISPLAFALLIGAALGFAAGFGVGTWGRSPGPDETAASDTRVASNTNPESSEAPQPQTSREAQPPQEPQESPESTTGRAREFTEGTVEPEVGTTANQPPRIEDRRSPPTPPIASPIVGSLLVRSTPLGARVLVDGREYGRTPLTVGNLSRGTHRVRVIRDGYEPDERQVTVTSAQRAHSMTVRLSPRRGAPQRAAAVSSAATRPAAPSAAPLTVESRPAGAMVFLDGRLVGTTPLVIPDVAAGDHALHLDRDGYRRWSSAIRIVTSERNRVAASLDR
jgi:hypothetical protein